MITLLIWSLLIGLSYGVSIGEEKPSLSKQCKVFLVSIFGFPVFLGLALKEHMDNVKAIKEKILTDEQGVN